jgi:hypothetical protein
MNTDDDTATQQRTQARHIATITPAANPSTDVSTPGTPEQLRDAIESIEQFVFDPSTANAPPEPRETTAYVMFPTRAVTELPELSTEAWPHADTKPNPISISKARKLLAAAYAAIPCELEGTGIHGYAWMIETDEQWEARGDTAAIVAPTKPTKETDYDVKKQMAYADRMEMYRHYHHLVQKGRNKLIEWFGKSMFMDLYVNELLPASITPKDLLQHLTDTYALGADNRRYMEQVEAVFASPYNRKTTVEAYFMRLQDARLNADLLGQPFTEQQTMNKALSQFEKLLGKDAYKAEKKWNEKEPIDRTWTQFKIFWKKEIHQWETVTKSLREANNAVTEQVDSLNARIDNMQFDMTALQAENRSHQEQNSALIALQRSQFQHALAAKQQERSNYGNNETSTITNYAAAYERGRRAGLSAATTANTSYTQQRPPGNASQRDLLHTAKTRAPDSYRHANDGRGKKFTKYCWKCGCNCTHWTRRCYELTDAEKQQYKDASFSNTMGGSSKFLDRRDKYQQDFQFDSL